MHLMVTQVPDLRSFFLVIPSELSATLADDRNLIYQLKFNFPCQDIQVSLHDELFMRLHTINPYHRTQHSLNVLLILLFHISQQLHSIYHNFPQT